MVEHGRDGRFMRTAVAACALALMLAACGRGEPPEAAGTGAEAGDGHADHGHDSLAGSEHAHDEPAGGDAPLVPGDGQRWTTDEPLRQAMTHIRGAVEEGAELQQAGRFDAAAAGSLASTVEREVAYMVEHCTLEPEADAALHRLIGRMMVAVGELRAEPPQPAGVADLEAVLQNYAHSFDHPGWPGAQADAS